MMVFSIVLSSINCLTFASTPHSISNPLAYEYMSGQIPFETLDMYLPNDYKNKPFIHVTINGKYTKLFFNTEIWVDKQIGVYGHYGYVPGNDFKNYTENDDPSITTPYYTKNGVKGEYRYHGYTINGIKHTNKSFPVDQASHRKPEQKTWQYQYWENSIIKARDDKTLSQYNIRALEGQADTQEWINKGLPFQIMNGSDESSSNVYDYANILTPSTLYSYGEAKMWHKNNTGYWYDTFTLIKRDGRKDTPVTLDITILNKGNNSIPIGANKTNIILDVTVTLKDEAYCDDTILKEIYYTRRDLKGFELTIDGKTMTLPKNGANAYRGQVTIPIRRDQVHSDGSYNVIGDAHAVYYQNITSPDANDHDEDKMKELPPRYASHLISEFTVEGYVYFSDEEPLVPEEFDYVDMSLGDIEEYTIQLRVRDGEYVERTYTHLDNDTMNNLLYSLVGDRKETIVDITQIVRNGSTTSSCSKRTRVYKTKSKETIKLKENIILPDKVFDILTYDVIANNLSDDDISRITVTVDGKEIQTSAKDFLNGQHVFGAINNMNTTELHLVEVSALSKDDMLTYIQKWVTVYNTKPNLHLQLGGTSKENRKLTIENTSDSMNEPYLLQHYPTVYTYEFTALEGDINDTNYEKHGENHIFQASKSGIYQIKLIGNNALNRKNEYILPLVVMPDHEPAMNFNVWNNYLARSETLDMEFGVESIDGDNITNKKIKILKDKDKDGTYETTIVNINLTDDYSYTPSELGWYRAIITADENFGQETVTKWLDGTHKRRNEIVRDFFVENLRPLAEVHLDIPFNFPQVDVLIALDKNLSQSKKASIKSKRIDYNNYLRSQGINPIIEMWDMKVYEYSTGASTSRNTGGSYPSSSISYSSGGYLGTLSRYSVSNNSYSRDEGYSRTVRECHTISQCCHPTWGCHDGGCDCGQSGHSQEGDCGDSSYSSREECTDRTEWVSDWVSYDNYTGYYSGTIYKYVRQQPPVQAFRANSDKYIIYVSESGINVTSPSEHKYRLTPIKEFSHIIEEHDLDITLIGNSAIKGQSTYDQYFDNANIESSINSALGVIIDQHPFSSDYLMQVGESINIETIELETEGDGLKENGFQYIHDPNYYDNPLGMLSYAKETYLVDGEWTTFKPTVLDKPGRFGIYYKTKDSIKNHEGEELISNIFNTTINVHRKPIAKFKLDWDYVPVTQLYKTRWVDESYDPDHQFSDPNKGIIDRKIVYWDHSRPTEKFYKIPDDLQANRTYTVEYIVQDMEGEWSDVYRQTITLKNIPPIQLKANLKTEDNKFVIGNIPSSENLVAFDIWTRFPYGIRLEVALYNTSNTLVAPVKNVTFTEGVTGIKTGNDITWNDILFQVPVITPDGQYKLVVKAIGADGQVSEIPFIVQVYTPIWEDYRNDTLQVIANPIVSEEALMLSSDVGFTEKNAIGLETSKYTDKINVVLDNNISFFIFADGTSGINANKVNSSMPFKAVNGSHQYQIEDLSVTTDDNSRVWSFNLSLVDGKPFMGEQEVTFKFYGYDTAGQWTSTSNKHSLNPREKKIKLLNLKLENLRIVNITDIDFKDLFQLPNGQPNNYMIPFSEMALYQNEKREKIALGYQLDFKIDSIGLYHTQDSIEINVDYYVLNQETRTLMLSDLYVKEYGTYIKVDMSTKSDELKQVILTKDNRYPYEYDPTNLIKNTWDFTLQVPRTARFVKKDSALEEIGYTVPGDSVLVVMTVVGKKNIGSIYNYTLKEEWAKGLPTYGYRRNTGKDLLGLGINHGEVFWYDLKRTSFDDLYQNREW